MPGLGAGYGPLILQALPISVHHKALNVLKGIIN